jgi:hypothetical protein
MVEAAEFPANLLDAYHACNSGEPDDCEEIGGSEIFSPDFAAQVLEEAERLALVWLKHGRGCKRA